jgi:hydroxymethylbilane synthase
MRKLRASEFSAIVLAEAGLERLGIHINQKRLPFVPSPNQGIVAVMASEEIREYDAVATLNDRGTLVEAMVERTIMETLGGGCLVPLGVFAQLQGDSVSVTAEVLSLDGQRTVRLADHILVENYDRGSRAFALRIKESGGETLIAEAVATGFSA